jgi:hypothetical protein
MRIESLRSNFQTILILFACFNEACGLCNRYDYALKPILDLKMYEWRVNISLESLLLYKKVPFLY